MKLRELKAEFLNEIDAVDVRMIIRMASGFDDIAQIVHADDEIDADTEAKARRILGKRLSGTPMAYITGEKEFYGLPFSVNEDVLIPRPDTETLVDAAIECASSFENPRILDLCTGSGAVGTAIAHTLSVPVALSDISEKALRTAAENYSRITGREPEARLGSLFEPWEGVSFDIIATNPPYVTDKWYEEVDKDVKTEPKLALIGGGDDGLDIIRKIIAEAPEHLNDGGYLLIECDYRQIALCARIMKQAGLGHIAVKKDLAGKERVIYGRKRT